MVIFVVILVIIFFCIASYNALIKKKNAVNNAESSIDVMLKKRFDVIPNLVSTVKAYTKHEDAVLTKLTDLRTQSMMPNLTQKQKVELDKQMTQALSSFRVSVEAYPDLKASEQFSRLQRSINEVEAQISAARRSFNAAVTEFNNAVEMFPSSIFANMMGLTTRSLFEMPETERANPHIDDLFGDS